jgi:hypothetical protein
MGRTDMVINSFFEDEKRFANVINQTIFQGKEIIDYRKLGSMEGKSHIYGEEDTSRDVVKKLYDNKTIIAIIALENQQNIHYAMPLRGMTYDSQSYEAQRRKIARGHAKRKDLQGSEWIGKFSKEDKLAPVITLIIYYGVQEWDGPTQLHDMLDISKEIKPFLSLIANYQLNLLEVTKIQNLEQYDNDLMIVFGFVKYQKDKGGLLSFVENHKNIFSSVSRETCRTVQAVANVNEIDQYVEKEESEVVDMCQALQELMSDCKVEGQLEGRRQGQLEGETRFAALVKILLHHHKYDLIEQITNDTKLRNEMYRKYKI